MTIQKIQKVINTFEGAGTFVQNTPLVLYNIESIVNSFDWSTVRVGYHLNRIMFSNGMMYVIPVIEVPNKPEGVVGEDYDIVKGKYWLYMKPNNDFAWDVFSMTGIGAFTIKAKVSGGVIK